MIEYIPHRIFYKCGHCGKEFERTAYLRHQMDFREVMSALTLSSTQHLCEDKTLGIAYPVGMRLYEDHELTP